MAKAPKTAAPRDRTYWQTEIEKGKQRFRTFWDDGDHVIDEYRQQKASGAAISGDDKYNILYSSTETIRPNLYATEPNVRVQVRQKDRADAVARNAVQILENTLQYTTKEEDFDEVLENVVEDLLLPGLGQAWIRYEPTFSGDAGQETVIDEEIRIEYVYWQDFMTGVTRGWASTPWVARRIWMTKDAATKRFGAEKANLLSYATREKTSRDADAGDLTAEIWEIWDKGTKTVYWYAENYAAGLLDFKADPLKLKRFFPCPRPLRAVSNTRTFTPRALYSQYKSQAKQLNTLTRRIRLLTEAVRVVGVFDKSQASLQNLLSPNGGNVMIGVDSWAMFAQQGGLKGNIEWLPLDAVVTALVQLLQAREVCKQEIYEITGFSDIVRGVSKASETLGAQNLKANWASARLRKMQKDVQRFARDVIAIAGEVIAEMYSPETLAIYGGVRLPTAEEVQANPERVSELQMFKASTDLLRSEKMRCAKIDIETDSTILADEEAERKDRMDFLGSAGAFLQQAVPAMENMPELGTLLGALLMFTVRTFPSSRPIEEEFEKLQKVLESTPPKKADNGAAAAEAAKSQTTMAVANMQVQSDSARAQLDQQTAIEKIQSSERIAQNELTLKQQMEANRASEKHSELVLRERELALRERELALREAEVVGKQKVAEADSETRHNLAETTAHVAEHNAVMAEAGHVQEYEKMRRSEKSETQSGESGEGGADAS